jgi:hypothetical protein
MTKKEREAFLSLAGHMYNLVFIIDKMEREKHRSRGEKRQLAIMGAFLLSAADEISSV